MNSSVTPQPLSPAALSLPVLPTAKNQHPLMEKLRALVQTGDDLQRRAAEFMLKNTVGLRWDVNSEQQTSALWAIVNKIENGQFSNWSAFSQNGLAPYVKAFYPTPPEPIYDAAWYARRRDEEAERQKVVHESGRFSHRGYLAGARPNARA